MQRHIIHVVRRREQVIITLENMYCSVCCLEDLLETQGSWVHVSGRLYVHSAPIRMQMVKQEEKHHLDTIATV